MEWFCWTESSYARGEDDGRQSNTVKFLLYELSLPSFGLLFLLSELCRFVCSECVTPSDFVEVLFLCNNKLFLEKCNAIKLSLSKRTKCSQLDSTPFPQKISCSFFLSSYIVYLVNYKKNSEILLESFMFIRALSCPTTHISLQVLPFPDPSQPCTLWPFFHSLSHLIIRFKMRFSPKPVFNLSLQLFPHTHADSSLMTSNKGCVNTSVGTELPDSKRL